MSEFEKEKIQWLEYDLINDEPILEGVTFLRHGGTSEHNYKSLNLSDNVGDHPKTVLENREIIKKFFNTKNMIFPNQLHSNIVMEVTKDNMNKHFDCDALVTKEKKVALAICHADCQAAIFFDPEYNVIAAAHAGWRGLVKNIYSATIDYMVNNFNCRKSNIKVCVSPSLGPDSAEFKNYKNEFPKSFWSYETKEKHFDLWQIAKDQLKDAGLQENNIEFAKIDTFLNEKDYYSYRREKRTGRNATVIMLS
ncbi:MAG: peptidoglycan editing factor PgeF [Parachlamydiales bacterium]|nr:peptidoglycan editing factor PgeF [Parachlamydiales bacterium]